MVLTDSLKSLVIAKLPFSFSMNSKAGDEKA